jgi:hypothetical protein
MKDYIPLLTGLITGLFALAGVCISSFLNSKKDAAKSLRDEKISKRNKVESVYTEFLGKIHRVEQHVQYGRTKADDVMSFFNEGMVSSVITTRFYATEKVTNLINEYLESVDEWSDKYQTEFNNCANDDEKENLSSDETSGTDELKSLRIKRDRLFRDTVEAMREHLEQIVN